MKVIQVVLMDSSRLDRSDRMLRVWYFALLPCDCVYSSIISSRVYDSDVMAVIVDVTQRTCSASTARFVLRLL